MTRKWIKISSKTPKLGISIRNHVLALDLKVWMFISEKRVRGGGEGKKERGERETLGNTYM